MLRTAATAHQFSDHSLSLFIGFSGTRIWAGTPGPNGYSGFFREQRNALHPKLPTCTLSVLRNELVLWNVLLLHYPQTSRLDLGAVAVPLRCAAYACSP